jgi:hypothetical protein
MASKWVLKLLLVLCSRNKFKKAGDHFGDACLAELNQKNSTSTRLRRASGLRQLLILRPAAASVFIPKCSMALAKIFQTHLFNFVKYFWDTTLVHVSRRQTDYVCSFDIVFFAGTNVIYTLFVGKNKVSICWLP